MVLLKIRNSKAFTLVEIMIVLAIIGILVATSVPVILRSRMNANENVVKSNLRLIRDALESYRASQPTALTYPPDLPTLATMTPSLLDRTLANAVAPPGKQGYYYVYNFQSSNQFALTATPVSSGVSGKNSYFVDESGVVRYTDASGPPVE